jgi:voltage-gated potassium channel
MAGAQQKEGAAHVHPADTAPKKSNAYEMFILVLTVLSLLIMVALLLPLNDATLKLLTVYDNLICVVFLVDFGINLKRSDPKRDYVVGRRGWLDLLGSVPSFGFFRFTALLRLARLSRLTRIARLLRGQNKRELVRDVVTHRGQYAAFITVLAAFIVLTVASVLVLQFEGASPEANITTGGGALWWGIVTLTTVGYGDEYPVTMLGRITAALVMLAGVGVIGALASILASILVPPAQTQEERDDDASAARTLEHELAEIRSELTALRRSLAVDGADPPGGHPPS